MEEVLVCTLVVGDKVGKAVERMEVVETGTRILLLLGEVDPGREERFVVGSGVFVAGRMGRQC